MYKNINILSNKRFLFITMILTPCGRGLIMDPGRCAAFLPSSQLSGSPCRTKVLVMKDFATYVLYLSALMQYLYIVHVCMYTCVCTRMHYVAIQVTCVLVGMRLYMSTGPVASLISLRLLGLLML